MTRFARAKGSKASNERTPEKATSWQEMKRQMEEKKQEERFKKEKAEFESKKAIYGQSSSEVDTSVKWANFQEMAPSKKIRNESKGNVESTKSNKTKKKKKKNVSNEQQFVTNNNQMTSKNEDLDEAAAYDSDDAPAEVSAKITPIEVATKPKKRKKERIMIDINAGRNKTNEIKKQKLATSENMSNEEITENFKTGQKKKIKRDDKTGTQQGKAQSNKSNKKPNDFKKSNVNQYHDGNRDAKRKLPKIRDDKEHKRRKPLLEDTTIILNGKKIELMYFGGFLIKKEDANRLFKLRNEMRKKGVPRSEIEITLKLERRKAEKALAREKKKLCFHCRQSGHELSECPDINESPTTQSIGTGICFKCGSTEHTHYECKVVRNENYKFATCFICKEEGHISKQCPDNPKGIYPRGGGCRICQDVTHLKKDCPMFQQQQESTNATLDTIGSENIEGIGGEDVQVGTRKKMTPKKIIKFQE